MSIAYKIYKKCTALWYHFHKLPIVYCGSPSSKKKALLVYLSEGINKPSNSICFKGHQNYKQSKIIAHMLADRGFRVTVVNYNDANFEYRDKYDVVIAHPGIVSTAIQKRPRSGFQLCLRTGRDGQWIKAALQKRTEDFQDRRGYMQSTSSYIEEQDSISGFDAIACFDGNGSTAKTFEHIGLPVYPFRNYANPDIKYVNKKFDEAKLAFVYIASHLHLLKGLDLLIETFSRSPNCQLYICGLRAGEFRTIYEYELSLPNIHSLGYVDLLSPTFRRVCEKAAWYISPSASDGCQGAALDSMAAGLIPILSDSSGVDTAGIGFRIEPCNLDILSTILHEIAHISETEIMNRSLAAHNLARSKYSESSFIEDWAAIFDAIL